MGKEKKAPKAVAVTMVTVKDLEGEYGVEARKLRAFLRGLGLRAPEVVGQTGFGPKAKYTWPSDSKELVKIREAIEENMKADVEANVADDEDEDDE